MTETIDTLIIGAGQSGLSLSYYLTRQGRKHLLLEQAPQLAEPWRNQRWDSFTLVTPNWMIGFPGGEYQGNDPDGFMPRAEIVSYLERYAASFNAPVRFNVRAFGLDRVGDGYQVQTSQGAYKAAHVVIAAGFFQQPRIPAFHDNLSPKLTQIHSSQYRNPDKLPPGAVLVVGSAQSGCQIAEELYQSGRKVFMSIGDASGRAPRRYRGRDVTRWLFQMGFFDRAPEQITPEEKLATTPQISGKNGGHTLNLHQFARDGVSLAGRINAAQGKKVSLAPDLNQSLKKIDQFEVNVIKAIDDYIMKNHIDAPSETLPQLTDGYQNDPCTELDFEAAGITSLVWAIGYRCDFSWIHLPVLDEDGLPIQHGGVTAFPGLYFLGLPLQRNAKSGGVAGAGEDAAYIASHIAGLV